MEEEGGVGKGKGKEEDEERNGEEEEESGVGNGNGEDEGGEKPMGRRCWVEVSGEKSLGKGLVGGRQWGDRLRTSSWEKGGLGKGGPGEGKKTVGRGSGDTTLGRMSGEHGAKGDSGKKRTVEGEVGRRWWWVGWEEDGGVGEDGMGENSERC